MKMAETIREFAWEHKEREQLQETGNVCSAELRKENPMPIFRRPNLEPEHWMVLAAYFGKLLVDRKMPDCFHVFSRRLYAEEIDETLKKYGLSCDDISNWE